MMSIILSSGPNPTIEPFTKNLNSIDPATNDIYEHLLWGSLGMLATLVLVVRISKLFSRRIRRL
jgi:hypothetical protein